MMETTINKKSLGVWLSSLVITAGCAVFFSKSIASVRPAYYLILALVGIGIVLGDLLPFAIKSQLEKKTAAGGATLLLVFQIIHGGLAYVLTHYLFHQNLMASLAYPAGALMGFFLWWLFATGFNSQAGGVLGMGLTAGGLAISLRLFGVNGGLFFALALVNSYWMGTYLLKTNPSGRELWERSIFFAALLAVGRAAIQYYLLKSNYANLGVVITHSYTYVALSAGIFLPALAWVLRKDRLVHPVFIFIFLGILFPLILGGFVHVRPMAGYLLGLVTSAFLFGMLFEEAYLLGFVSYLSLASVVWALPLFQALNNLSRGIRLEVLGGLFFLTALVFLFTRLLQGKESPGNV